MGGLAKTDHAKPSIAVLPFANLSNDPEQEYFADGLADDLITDLSKIPSLFVVSRNSTFTYKGMTTSPRQVAADLGVRYVLEGSVRRIGDDVRINVQVTDATTGGYLWAERYDGGPADVLSLPERVATQVAGALALDLTAEQWQGLGRLGTENMEAHDAYLLGLSYYFRRTPEGFAAARDQFRRAIELDPDYAAPRVAIAKIYAQVRSIAYSGLWRSTSSKPARRQGPNWRLSMRTTAPTVMSFSAGAEQASAPPGHRRGRAGPGARSE